jgi:hypothetical protein
LILQVLPVFAAIPARHLMLVTVDHATNLDFTAAARADIPNPSFMADTMMLSGCVAFTHYL